MVDFDSAWVALSLEVSSSFDESASSMAVSTPMPIMYADCAIVSWMVWDSSMRSRCSSRSRSTASLLLVRSSLNIRFTAATTAYIVTILMNSTFSSPTSMSTPEFRLSAAYMTAVMVTHVKLTLNDANTTANAASAG